MQTQCGRASKAPSAAQHALETEQGSQHARVPATQRSVAGARPGRAHALLGPLLRLLSTAGERVMQGERVSQELGVTGAFSSAHWPSRRSWQAACGGCSAAGPQASQPGRAPAGRRPPPRPPQPPPAARRERRHFPHHAGLPTATRPRPSKRSGVAAFRAGGMWRAQLLAALLLAIVAASGRSAGQPGDGAGGGGSGASGSRRLVGAQAPPAAVPPPNAEAGAGRGGGTAGPGGGGGGGGGGGDGRWLQVSGSSGTRATDGALSGGAHCVHGGGAFERRPARAHTRTRCLEPASPRPATPTATPRPHARARAPPAVQALLLLRAAVQNWDEFYAANSFYGWNASTPVSPLLTGLLCTKGRLAWVLRSTQAARRPCLRCCRARPARRLPARSADAPIPTNSPPPPRARRCAAGAG